MTAKESEKRTGSRVFIEEGPGASTLHSHPSYFSDQDEEVQFRRHRQYDPPDPITPFVSRPSNPINPTDLRMALEFPLASTSYHGDDMDGYVDRPTYQPYTSSPEPLIHQLDREPYADVSPIRTQHPDSPSG